MLHRRHLAVTANCGLIIVHSASVIGLVPRHICNAVVSLLRRSASLCRCIKGVPTEMSPSSPCSHHKPQQPPALSDSPLQTLAAVQAQRITGESFDAVRSLELGLYGAALGEC